MAPRSCTDPASGRCHVPDTPGTFYLPPLPPNRAFLRAHPCVVAATTHGSEDNNARIGGGQGRKRAGVKRSMGCGVEPVVARSARISPTTGANLNPWPEKPTAT